MPAKKTNAPVFTDDAPQIASKRRYGMPEYAKDGGVICFFQAGSAHAALVKHAAT